MKRYNKGEYGYLNSYRKGKLIVALILAFMIAFIVVSMLLMFGDTGRVLIVFAILLALPFAKFLIAWIMCAGFRPLSEEEYQHICHGITSGNEQGLSGVYFDVVITQYEGMKFYRSMCVKNGKIIALVDVNGFRENKKEYETWIAGCTSDSKYRYSITVTEDVEQYIKKVRSISTPNDKTALIDRHMLEKILVTCV